MEQTALQTELTDEELKQALDRVKAADDFSASGSESPEETEQVLCDEYGFPFEPEGMYNSAPLEFEEVTKALWVVLNNLNHAATRYNRLSPHYPMLMQQLEKNIKQMGSHCITKTILEQGGQEFPDLEPVCILELYKMVSVQFRKCCMAYNDLQRENHTQDMGTIVWLFRWAALAGRLKATQEKISKIKSGELKVESLLKRETVYQDEPKQQRDCSHRRVSPMVRASALPILRSFAGEVKAQVRAAEKQEQAARREAEREKKRREKEEEQLLKEIGLPLSPFIPLPEKTRGLDTTEIGLWKMLMDDAKKMRDQIGAEPINRESFDEKIENADHPGEPEFEFRMKHPGGSSRSGPSDETRKKLREKRKKNRK